MEVQHVESNSKRRRRRERIRGWEERIEPSRGGEMENGGKEMIG